MCKLTLVPMAGRITSDGTISFSSAAVVTSRYTRMSTDERLVAFMVNCAV